MTVILFEDSDFLAANKPEGLASIIADYFKVRCGIEEFVGHWIEIPPADRLKIGQGEIGRLGLTAVIGSKSWDCAQRFRIRIGPLSLADLAARFTGKGPWKKRLPQIIDTLEALGRARRDVEGRVVG